MATFSTAVEVARPPEEVFAYATDPTKFGEWQANVTSGHMDGSDPHEVGARCVTTRTIGFAERAVTSEVTHSDPPFRWGVRGIDGPVRALVGVCVDPIDDGRASRLTISIEFHGHGIGKLLVPLAISRQARKEMPANLERLKHRVEGQVGDRQRPAD